MSSILCVKVTNKGKYDGDDVAQLYVRDVVAETTRPMRELKGFGLGLLPQRYEFQGR